MSGKAPQANTFAQYQRAGEVSRLHVDNYLNRRGKKKNKRGEANGSAAPWRGCPLGLVHLHLREFCFCRKLEEARVG